MCVRGGGGDAGAGGDAGYPSRVPAAISPPEGASDLQPVLHHAVAATKAATLRINLNVEGCGIVAAVTAAPRPSARSFTRSPSSPPPSFTQSPFPPRSLVRDGQTSPHSPRLGLSRR